VGAGTTHDASESAAKQRERLEKRSERLERRREGSEMRSKGLEKRKDEKYDRSNKYYGPIAATAVERNITPVERDRNERSALWDAQWRRGQALNLTA
jgi:hypothetical protein